jgi:hypothetical protein
MKTKTNRSKFFLYIISLLVLLVNPNKTEAQEMGSFHALRLAPLGLSYSYEFAIYQQFGLLTEGGLVVGVYGKEKTANIQPYLNVEPRCYYNLSRRSRENKNIAYNSSNYLSLSAVAIFDPLSGAINFDLNPKWGIRRVLSSHFFWGLDLGVIFLYESKIKELSIYPFPNLRIGYVLLKNPKIRSGEK